MPSAYIVECVRTAVGKRKGTLAEAHPVDTGAHVINALVDRTGINPAAVDDVIFGCVSQVGAQAGNIGRNVVLASKLPESVPGVSCDRQCGSSQQAIHFAAQAVMSGVQDVVIAGGTECMTQVPIGSNIMDGMAAGHGQPFNNTGMETRYPDVQFSQFEGAELLAEKYAVTREEMDTAAIGSHTRAHHAIAAGKFEREIAPFKGFAKDEGVRFPVNEQKIRSMPTMKDGGRITAAAASQISDGAAAVLICNEAGLKKLGLKPRAKIVSLAVAGDDPVVMLGGPIPASKIALAKLGVSIRDMDRYEVNEAFASVPLAWAKALKADLNKLNVNGGAMALGHPLGATGAKLMTTLVNELERENLRYGLLAICEGGGTSNCTIIERCVGAKL